MGKGVYVASRASVPERSAMWRRLLRMGWPITSSWIDDTVPAPGKSGGLRELWMRILEEITGSVGLVLYAEPGDFPLKGALVEVGIALGRGLPVIVVAPGVAVDPVSCRPLGSWVRHPSVSFNDDVVAALRSLVPLQEQATNC